MYGKKIEEILLNLEDGKIHLAGGSAIGMVLSIVNALIKYIANLSLGKKKYENVQDKVKEILNDAEELKQKSIKAIDKDKEILEQILNAYKIRKEDGKKYQEVLKNAVIFCMDVVSIAYDTLILSDRISKVGNKMLESDFKICKYYAIASIQSSIVNVQVNLKDIEDINYKVLIEKKCNKILQKAMTI